MIILSIGLLAVAGMQIASIKNNNFSSNLTQATILAEDKVEYLKNARWDNNFCHPDLSTGQHNEGVLSGTVFSREHNVVDLTTTMKTITVSIRWTDRSNHSISLSTIRAK